MRSTEYSRAALLSSRPPALPCVGSLCTSEVCASASKPDASYSRVHWSSLTIDHARLLYPHLEAAYSARNYFSRIRAHQKTQNPADLETLPYSAWPASFFSLKKQAVPPTERSLPPR